MFAITIGVTTDTIMAIRKSPDSNYPGSKVSTHELLRGIITFVFLIVFYFILEI